MHGPKKENMSAWPSRCQHPGRHYACRVRQNFSQVFKVKVSCMFFKKFKDFLETSSFLENLFLWSPTSAENHKSGWTFPSGAREVK